MRNDGRREWWWWALVCGGLTMGLALGVRHVQGLFMLPVTLERGWSREVFALALALQNLVWGLAQPLAGMWADRAGSRPVLVFGALAYALGLLGMTQATQPWTFQVCAGGLVGLGLAGTAFGVVYGALSRLLPPAQRAAGLGMAGAVGGLGQFLSVPVAQGLIDGLGWQQALAVFALLTLLAIGLGGRLDDRVALAGMSSPRQGLAATLRDVLAQRDFWLLNLGFLACGFQLAFIAGHLPAYLADRGLPASTAVTGLALIALTNVVGTWLCGWLGGRWPKHRLLSQLYLLRTAAMALFLLLPLSPWTLYPFCAAMGLLWLGTLPLTNGLVGQIWGVRYVSTLFGFVFLGHQLGAFLGVWLGGRVFEATRSYEPLWWAAMALGLLAAALHWPIDTRSRTAALA